jgi:hypothetical protein
LCGSLIGRGGGRTAGARREPALGYIACGVLSLFAVVGAIAATGGNGVG